MRVAYVADDRRAIDIAIPNMARTTQTPHLDTSVEISEYLGYPMAFRGLAADDVNA